VAALAGGWLFDWNWLDPATGIIGALVVAVWAKNLLGATGKILLDREMDAPVVEEIRAAAEAGEGGQSTRVHDLHVWRVGPRAYACALAVTTSDRELTAEKIRQRLADHEEIVHSTIEISVAPPGRLF
jgi:Co/Zn/Cd efflux system component